MARRSNRHHHIASRILLLVMAWFVLPSQLALANEPRVEYFSERTFEIPYSMSPDQPFRSLRLHVSTDEGKTYNQIGSTTKREGAFVYSAKGDGWYLFIVQVENQDGTFTPARVQLSRPMLSVCVDTEKPLVTLRAVAPRKGGTVAVEWSVRDRTLNLSTLRLEYRPVGAARWTQLNIQQLEHAQFEWNPSGPGPFEVRLVVRDKANLSGEATTQVRPDPSAPSTGGTGMGTGSIGSTAGGSITPPTGDRPVIYVNKKTFKLTYKIDRIGPSRVKHVEVWMTRDTRQWMRYQGGDAPPEGPFEITVNAQGRYGFTLLPVSGVGRKAPPPQPPDLPQVWVEVDETAPVVKLHNVVVNELDEPSTITVNWRAEDRFLADQPVTIYYSTTSGPEARWEILQANVENTGSCKCKTQGLPFEFFVRIEVVDRAGNKSADQTRETVKVDLSVPTITDVNVTIGEGGARPPG